MELHTSERFRDALSDRERQLLTLAAQGFTDNAIAQKLGISLATVGTYWGRVRIKMGPLNRTELVAHFLREEAADTLSVLQEENQGLIREIEDITKTAEMLKASLEMFRGLIDTAPDAIIVVNEDGDIQLVNEQACEMFRYTQEEFLKISVEQLVPERYRHAHISHREQYHRDPIKKRMAEHLATMARRSDGSEFPMATALSATKSGDNMLVTCIIRDFSDIWKNSPKVETVRAFR